MTLQPANQQAMTPATIGECPTLHRAAHQYHDQLFSAHIDSTPHSYFRRLLVHACLLELSCVRLPPRQTVVADLEHAGSVGLRFSTASQQKGGGRSQFQALKHRPTAAHGLSAETQPIVALPAKKIQGCPTLRGFRRVGIANRSSEWFDHRCHPTPTGLRMRTVEIPQPVT